MAFTPLFTLESIDTVDRPSIKSSTKQGDNNSVMQPSGDSSNPLVGVVIARFQVRCSVVPGCCCFLIPFFQFAVQTVIHVLLNSSTIPTDAVSLGRQQQKTLQPFIACKAILGFLFNKRDIVGCRGIVFSAHLLSHVVEPINVFT